ncbi:MAG: hypothetical protein RSE57_06450 [Clostridia bacterium]
MKIEICWKEKTIVTITRLEGIYVYSLNKENFTSARKKGMPIIEILSVKLVSKKLPKFIEERIPSKEIRNKELVNISNDEGENILNYIKATKCILKTDEFSVNLT